MNSNRKNKTLQKLNSFIKDINDGNVKELLEKLQLMCDYQAEKIRIYEEHLTKLTVKERLDLTDSDKKRLAHKSKELNDYILSTIEPTWSVSTVRGWYYTLVGEKYNSVDKNQKKRGRKPIYQKIIDEVLMEA